MIGRNLDDAEEWIRSWTSRISAQAETAAQLSDRVARLTATASGVGGAVKVTVTGSGEVTAIELDDRVQRISGRDLSSEIMRVMRVAQGQITKQVGQAVDETVGSDSETGRAVMDSFERRFPQQPEDPADEQDQHHGR